MRAYGCKTESIISINLLYVTFHCLLKTRNLSIFLDCSLSFTLEFLDMDQFIAFFFISSVTYLIQSIALFSFTSSGVSLYLVRSPLQFILHTTEQDFSKMQIIHICYVVFKSVQ